MLQTEMQSIASACKTNKDKNVNNEVFPKLVKWLLIEIHKIYSEFGGSLSRNHLINKIT